MSAAARLEALLDHLGLDLDPGLAAIRGSDPVLASRYPLGESTAAVLAAVGLAAGRLGELRGGDRRRVDVDVRHAGAHTRGFLDQIVDGQDLDGDPTGKLPAVGLFRAGDGSWVQTYGVFSPLLERTVGVLGCEPEREAIARAVAGWEADELAEALNAAGAPGVAVRTGEEWAEHPQGRALVQLPVVRVERIGEADARPLPAGGGRPLDGVRVVDLSRIVAGPTCTRTLAEQGAEVVALTAERMAAIHRATVDTSPGKRSAFCDLDDSGDRRRLDALVAGADVFCQSARPGSFARRGLGPDDLAERVPGIVYVSTDCFGGVGPWGDRAGFEPLAQASTGWAHDHADGGRPTIVAALPCDYATGFLSALGAMTALERRAAEGGSWHVHTSLSRTAMWFRDQPGRLDPQAAPRLTARSTMDLRERVDTAYGVIEPLRPGVELDGAPVRWAYPPAPPVRGEWPAWTSGSGSAPGD